eukprot:1067128-Alexandrium_andersonii.AAC.1
MHTAHRTPTQAQSHCHIRACRCIRPALLREVTRAQYAMRVAAICAARRLQHARALAHSACEPLVTLHLRGS